MAKSWYSLPMNQTETAPGKITDGTDPSVVFADEEESVVLHDIRKDHNPLRLGHQVENPFCAEFLEPFGDCRQIVFTIGAFLDPYVQSCFLVIPFFEGDIVSGELRLDQPLKAQGDGTELFRSGVFVLAATCKGNKSEEHCEQCRKYPSHNQPPPITVSLAGEYTLFWREYKRTCGAGCDCFSCGGQPHPGWDSVKGAEFFSGERHGESFPGRAARDDSCLLVEQSANLLAMAGRSE